MFSRQVGFVLLIVVGLTGCHSQEGSERTPPNIVIIVADDLGWNDVSYHGSEIQTPHIDQLVREGMELDRFYAAPICSPTRAGLMSGHYPDRYGMRHGVISPRVIGGLPPEVTTLAEMLGDAGYTHRAAFGKWHLGHSAKKYHPMMQGFTSFYGHYNGAIDYYTHSRNGTLDWHENYLPSKDEGYSTELLTKKVTQFIAQQDEEPFFAYVAYNAAHSPMQAREEQLEAYGYDAAAPMDSFPVGGSQNNEYNLPGYGEKGRGNTLRQTFSAMVGSLDEGIGKIMESLKENGLEENTVVWFLSDNGGMARFGGNNLPLRGGKHTEWEGGVRVASAVRWPGHIEAGSRSEQLMSFIDVWPTLHDIAGATKKVETDGMDVLPALLGKPVDRGYVFLGNNTIISQQWKLKDSLLFEIEKDPNETQDVAEQYPDRVRAMTTALDSIRRIVDTGVTLPMRPQGWRPEENWQYEPAQDTAGKGMTYSNPLDVKFGDPFILSDGDGKYYMYGTGGVKDGFGVYSSSDLVHWKDEGPVFQGNDGDSWGVGAFWAPEVYKKKGKYYMFYSAQWKVNPTRELENFMIGVAESDAPTGPFNEMSDGPLFTPDYPVIDANVFRDDDGKNYLYFSRVCYKHPVESEVADWARQKGWYDEIEESWVYGIELKPDFSGVIGQPVLLLRPPVKMDDRQAEWESRSVTSHEVGRRWTEGSVTFKHDGRYYIMYSANHFAGENYAVGYATSDSPLGPFTKAANNPVLQKNTGEGGKVSGTGHNNILYSPDSTEMYCVYHGRTTATGQERVVFLDRMTFKDDGTLVVHGPTTDPQPLPDWVVR